MPVFKDKGTLVLAVLVLAVLGFTTIVLLNQGRQIFRSQAAGTPIAVTLFLHGVGKGGDSANPTGSGNMSPQKTQRAIQLEVYNQQNQLVGNQQGTVTYNGTNGNFTGTIDLGTTLPTGVYTVKIKSNQYLRGLVPGIQTITSGQPATLPPTYLITGDMNNDNIVNIADYNILIGCYSDLTAATNCTATQKVAADITDDGQVNAVDYNLFLRELTNMQGETGGGNVITTTPTPVGSTPTPTRTPTPGPATPTRTPTPPVATPTRTPTPPVTGSRPGPNNTGVPAGTNLTNSGSITVTTANTVIDSKNIQGCVTIQASNVTITRSKITCSDYYPIEVVSGSLLIVDSEIYAASGTSTAGISVSNYTARRVNIHGGKDGLKAQNNVVIEDSWIHDLWLTPLDHADGIQQDGGGSNITIKGNFIDAVDHGFGHGGEYNAGIQVDKGAASNFLIEGNWIYGDSSGYGINFRANGGSNNRIINNRFGRGAGIDTLHTEGSVTVSGNVWDDTGTPIN